MKDFNDLLIFDLVCPGAYFISGPLKKISTIRCNANTAISHLTVGRVIHRIMV